MKDNPKPEKEPVGAAGATAIDSERVRRGRGFLGPSSIGRPNGNPAMLGGGRGKSAILTSEPLDSVDGNESSSVTGEDQGDHDDGG